MGKNLHTEVGQNSLKILQNWLKASGNGKKLWVNVQVAIIKLEKINLGRCLTRQLFHFKQGILTKRFFFPSFQWPLKSNSKSNINSFSYNLPELIFPTVAEQPPKNTPYYTKSESQKHINIKKTEAKIKPPPIKS